MTPARVDSIIRGDPRELAKLAFSVFTAALARNPSDATQLLVEIFQDACDRVVNRSGQTARPGESQVRGKLTGPMLTKLATLVSEHFDQQELRTVLRLYLSRDAANILPPNSPPYHQALQLFLVAERDGWTSQLIDALSDYSKSDEFRVALDSDLKGWLSLCTST